MFWFFDIFNKVLLFEAHKEDKNYYSKRTDSLIDIDQFRDKSAALLDPFKMVNIALIHINYVLDRHSIVGCLSCNQELLVLLCKSFNFE